MQQQLTQQYNRNYYSIEHIEAVLLNEGVGVEKQDPNNQHH